MKNNKLACLCALILLLPSCRSKAQNAFVDPGNPPAYSFIRNDQNLIHNPEHLFPFLERLFDLRENGNSGKTDILHVGDSHIQADHLSGQVRFRLQRLFGNAGRGLIQPARIAKSNESSTYKCVSNGNWTYKRCVFPDRPMPIGLDGITIRTDSALTRLRLYVNSKQADIDYAFNTLTILYDKTDSAMDIVLYDTNGINLQRFSAANPDVLPFTGTACLAKTTDVIDLEFQSNMRNGYYFQCYGFYAENSLPGIIYNSVGVNGAQYFHYAEAEYFAAQSILLKPKLIIVSLGTNEAQDTRFQSDLFYKQIDSLVKSLREWNPSAAILLTTPPDSYYRRKYYNPRISAISQTIRLYAEREGLSYWDLYTITGGHGSCAKWKTSRLLASDGVHFTAEGYRLQGELLTYALLTAYNTYVHHRSR